jgi:hypothetical protein
MTRIESTVSGVRLTYEEDGRKIVREFYTSKVDQTGYVFEADHKQVCERLYSTGHTLESRGNLLATIRREWRRYRADRRRTDRA